MAEKLRENTLKYLPGRESRSASGGLGFGLSQQTETVSNSEPVIPAPQIESPNQETKQLPAFTIENPTEPMVVVTSLRANAETNRIDFNQHKARLREALGGAPSKDQLNPVISLTTQREAQPITLAAVRGLDETQQAALRTTLTGGKTAEGEDRDPIIAALPYDIDGERQPITFQNRGKASLKPTLATAVQEVPDASPKMWFFYAENEHKVSSVSINLGPDVHLDDLYERMGEVVGRIPGASLESEQVASAYALLRELNPHLHLPELSRELVSLDDIDIVEFTRMTRLYKTVGEDEMFKKLTNAFKKIYMHSHSKHNHPLSLEELALLKSQDVFRKTNQ